MPYARINFSEKFARFGERWSPRIVAQMNDYHFKLVRIQGEFIWHSHPETDEVFIVLDGEMTIHLRDGDIALADRRDVRRAARCGAQAVRDRRVPDDADRAGRHTQYGRRPERPDRGGRGVGLT